MAPGFNRLTLQPAQGSNPLSVLDAFFSAHLDCDIASIPPGRTVIVSPCQQEESGRYYADVPALWMLLTQSRCVISVQDLFFKRVSALVRVMGIERFRNPETVRRFVLIASKAIGVRHGVNSVSGPVLYCTSESLLPVRLYPCRLITKEDIPALKEAGLYDSSLDYSIEQGTCFAAFDQDQPVSLAGTYPVPHMAELVAEIAVPGTIATHRRLGYGRTALSSTTEAVLNQNRVPVYITSDQNMASQDTAKAVGYRLYGWQFRIRLVRPDIDTQRRAF